MLNTAMRSVPAFVSEALVASQVGTWVTNLDDKTTVCDATTAVLFGVDPDEAAQGVPIEAMIRNIHPEDRAGFATKARRTQEHGGLYVVEYRTVPRPGEVRWVLVRGRYEHDPVRGDLLRRGICIDITESKLDGQVEDKALFLTPDVEAGATPLDRAAHYMIEARYAIDDFEGRERLDLRRAIDAVLWAVGRVLARQQGGSST